MVLWMGSSIFMWQAGICMSVCVSWGHRQSERKRKRKECLLNANKKLKAYLQCVIPTAQLGFSLRQNSQQKVTAPALLPVTEIRITAFVCARRASDTASVCLLSACVCVCRFAFHSHFRTQQLSRPKHQCFFFFLQPWWWCILLLTSSHSLFIK